MIYAKDDIRCPAKQQGYYLQDLQNKASTNNVSVPLDAYNWPDFTKSDSYNDLIVNLLGKDDDFYKRKDAAQLSLSVIVAGALVFAQAML